MSISSGLIVCIALFIFVQFLITSLGKIWVFVSQATKLAAGEDNGTNECSLKILTQKADKLKCDHKDAPLEATCLRVLKLL